MFVNRIAFIFLFLYIFRDEDRDKPCDHSKSSSSEELVRKRHPSGNISLNSQLTIFSQTTMSTDAETQQHSRNYFDLVPFDLDRAIQRNILHCFVCKYQMFAYVLLLPKNF